MGKTILGVDVGIDTLKLALCKDGRIKKSAIVEMPANHFKDNRFTEPRVMAELLRSVLKQNHMFAHWAAIVLPNDMAYVRTVTVPLMTAEHLKKNLAYEFSDYIEDEARNYVFDYAMLSDPKNDGADTMELLAVACSAELIEQARDILGMANLSLVRAAPAECAFISLIRQMEKREKPKEPRDYCILDLGYRAIRMFMYRGDRHMVTRVLETGIRSVDEAVAAAMGVDEQLAHTFLASNYEGVQERQFCIEAYNSLTVELMRALNFYRFSNPDSSLSDVWLCGGGAGNATLRKVISETLDLSVHPGEELVPGGEEVPKCNHLLQAVGVTLE